MLNKMISILIVAQHGDGVLSLFMILTSSFVFLSLLLGLALSSSNSSGNLPIGSESHFQNLQFFC